MSVLDTAKDHVLGLLGRFADVAWHTTTSQTVTIAADVVAVEDFFRDPHRLSVVLGDLGEVRFEPPDRYEWHLQSGDADVTWPSRLRTEDSGLRFTGDDGHHILVRYRPAPGHRGTEVTVTAELPTPGLLAGAAVFTVLYRARALIQTGEVPTIVRNPSGRR